MHLKKLLQFWPLWIKWKHIQVEVNLEKKNKNQKKNPLVSMQQCLEPFNPYVVDVRRATKSSSS